MKNKITIFVGMLFFFHLAWIPYLSAQDLQISIDVFVPNAPPNNCFLGTLCLNCDGSFTFTGAGVATHIDLGLDSDPGPGGWVQTDLCNAYHAHFQDQPELFCDQTWTFPPGTVTTENNAQLFFQYYSESYFPDPVGCNGMDDEVHDVNLSDLLAALEDDCLEEPACPDGIGPSGSVEGFVDAFIAPGDNVIVFDFNSFWIPDQLIVHVNCEQVINSDIYSTSPSTLFHFNSLNTNCGIGGYVNGNGNHFIADIEVNEGDNVTIQVVGDNCAITGTWWALDVSCGRRDVVNYSFGSIEDEMFPTTYNPDLTSFTIYPNPAQDNLRYSLPLSDKPYQVTIFNVQGQVMHSSENNGGDTEISLSDYPNGVYLIQSIKGDEILIEKFKVSK